jgi:hypothetical protein
MGVSFLGGIYNSLKPSGVGNGIVNVAATKIYVFHYGSVKQDWILVNQTYQSPVPS